MDVVDTGTENLSVKVPPAATNMVQAPTAIVVTADQVEDVQMTYTDGVMTGVDVAKTSDAAVVDIDMAALWYKAWLKYFRSALKEH